MQIIKFNHLKWLFLSLTCLLSACQTTANQCTPDEIQPPKALNPIQATYPQRAIESYLEGLVTVTFHVDENGKVTQANIHQSSRIGVLDKAALDAVQKAVFQPALCKGKPIQSRAKIKLIFKVD
ncbi:MAG: energy transducer TonB [Alysiella sp.]|uniref:energy transducer TonB n=1 Tax=Alysiella sp. TaxID=1872483 RepID=UPI0026DAC228|nr:energy transducer TonB [Alysiella sp.]MDO4433518.1 energy transducer TonB [Alysiella sp.]